MPNEKFVIEDYNLTETSLLIVECAAFTYSVLRMWGCRLHYPIAVVADNLEAADELAGKLGIFQTKVLSTNLPPIEFRRALQSFHDDVCVLSHTNGRYTAENLEMLESVAASGGTEDFELCMPVLLVFQKVIPQEYQGLCSIAIQIGQADFSRLKRSEIESILDSLKNYILKKTQIVEYEIGQRSERFWEGKDSRFWSAAVNMLGQVFALEENVDKDRLKNHLCAAIQEAYSLAESYQFNSQIPGLFRELLDQSIPEICKLLPEARAKEYSEQDMQCLVLYDSAHYFLPEILFAKICEPLNTVCTVNQIKNVLADAGILCTQGQGRVYYTIKKRVSRSNIAVRFLCLNRVALEGDSMDLSFVDMSQIRRGK